jgi:hypothetical protein
MAGKFINFGDSIGHISFSDGRGSARVGRRTYRWEFHEYCGPFFLRKDGEALKIQPSEYHPVWLHFEKWLKRYKRIRAHTSRTETVEC